MSTEETDIGPGKWTLITGVYDPKAKTLWLTTMKIADGTLVRTPGNSQIWRVQGH